MSISRDCVPYKVNESQLCYKMIIAVIHVSKGTTGHFIFLTIGIITEDFYKTIIVYMKNYSLYGSNFFNNNSFLFLATSIVVPSLITK